MVSIRIYINSHQAKSFVCQHFVCDISTIEAAIYEYVRYCNFKMLTACLELNIVKCARTNTKRLIQTNFDINEAQR